MNGLSIEMQTWYDRQMRDSVKGKLLVYDYAQKRPYKKNDNHTVEFRKWIPFEGGVDSESITARVAGYGGYVAVSETLGLTAIDPTISDAVELMAEQAALAIDKLILDQLVQGGNAIFVNGRISRQEIEPGDRLTADDVRRAARMLKKNKTLPFVRGGKSWYVAIVGPDSTYGIQMDELWQPVGMYESETDTFHGEIGRISSVIFVELGESHVFKRAGARGKDVGCAIVFGQNAYGVTDIDAAHDRIRAVVNTPDPEDKSGDPLSKISTIGWKVDAFAVKLLQQGFLVRIEHGVGAES